MGFKQQIYVTKFFDLIPTCNETIMQIPTKLGNASVREQPSNFPLNTVSVFLGKSANANFLYTKPSWV